MESVYTSDGVPGRYWHALADGRIQCDLCPRECKLHEGQRGLCFVRARAGDEMVLTTYGRSSGFCLDPIEKKPLNHFLPGTAVLSFGTAGCNLTCKFCQNWDISKARDLDRLQQQASPQAIAQAACATGARSVAFTYNDPVIFLEYAVDVAAACREVGLQTVAVTAGYIGKVARPEFFAAMDAANIDLKAFTESFYKQLCTGSLDAVLDTLALRQTRDEDMARDHHLAYSRQERFVRGGGCSLRMGGDTAWARRATASHGLPSRLEDAGYSADSAFHSQTCP